MCNDALRIAIQYERDHGGEKVKSRFKLCELAYPRLKEYGLHTHYILSACEVAFSAYRNKKWKSAPHIKRAFMKLDNQSYILNHLILRIPVRPKRFVYLTLQASDYHLSFIDDLSMKRGSITVTENRVVICFSKEVREIEPSGQIGIDVNERNITWSDSAGAVQREDTSEVVELKELYRGIRAKISERTPITTVESNGTSSRSMGSGERQDDSATPPSH